MKTPSLADVSPLCLGTMTFGTPVPKAEAIGMVHRALDLGINFIDTANIYEGYARYIGSAGGVAEEILGHALRGRRHEVVLATKAGNAVGQGGGEGGLSQAHLTREAERSLRRLQTDCIDLFYLHRPDPDTPLEEPVAACGALIRAGKIKCWGFSNFDAAATQQLLMLSDAAGVPRPVANQAPLNLLQREVLQDLLPLCAAAGIATIAYQPLRGGVLTGKYRGMLPAGSRAQEKPDWMPFFDDAMRLEVETLAEEATAVNMTLLQYALWWALRQPSVISLAVGVKTTAQLDELWRAVTKGPATD